MSPPSSSPTLSDLDPERIGGERRGLSLGVRNLDVEAGDLQISQLEGGQGEDSMDDRVTLPAECRGEGLAAQDLEGSQIQRVGPDDPANRGRGPPKP